MLCVKDSPRSVDTAIIGRFRKYETAVTAKRADLKMELTNDRAANREPEVALMVQSFSSAFAFSFVVRPPYSNC